MTALIAGALIPLLAGGCGGGGGTATVARGTAVRVVNGMTEDVTIDVSLAGGDIIQGLARWSTTTDAEVPAGSQPLAILRSGTTTPLHQGIVSLNQDAKHTLVAYGDAANTGAMLILDPASPVAGGTSRIRMIHADPASPVLDLYLLEPGQDIATSRPVIATLAPRTASAIVEMPPGSYRMQIVRSGTSSSLLGANLTLAAGAGNTILVVDSPGASPPIFALVFPDRS